jgi:ABC-type Fe3+-hydroxamate transport system substrate-binding protein
VDYPTISYEDITVKSPSSILLPYDTTKTDKLKVEEDEISKSLSSTEAVKKNNFIVVDNNVVFRPGPRVIDAVKIIRSKVK